MSDIVFENEIPFNEIKPFDFVNATKGMSDKERKRYVDMLQKIGYISPTDDGFFGELSDSFNQSLVSGLRGTGATLEEFGFGSELKDYAQGVLNRNQDWRTPDDLSVSGYIGSALGGAAGSTAQTLGATAVGSLAGGGFGAALGFTSAFFNNYGDTVQRNRAAGYSEDKAALLGAAESLVNAGIEMFPGGLQKTIINSLSGSAKKKFAQGVIRSMSEKIGKQKTQSFLRNLVTKGMENGVPEALEEGGQYLNSYLFQKFGGDPNATFSFNEICDNMARGFIGGFGLGSVIPGGKQDQDVSMETEENNGGAPIAGMLPEGSVQPLPKTRQIATSEGSGVVHEQGGAPVAGMLPEGSVGNLLPESKIFYQGYDPTVQPETIDAEVIGNEQDIAQNENSAMGIQPESQVRTEQQILDDLSRDKLARDLNSEYVKNFKEKPLFDEIVKEFKIRMRFMNDDEINNGEHSYYDGRSDEIVINPAEEDNLNFVLGHEFKHRLDTKYGGLVKRFNDLVKQNLNKAGKEEIEDIKAVYQNEGISDVDAVGELSADTFGRFMMDADYWDRVAKRANELESGLGEKFMKALKDFAEHIMKAMRNIGSQEAEMYFNNAKALRDEAIEIMAKLRVQQKNEQKTNTITTPDNNTKVNVRYEVVDLDDLVTSDKQGYNKEYQPRNRDTRGSLEQIDRIGQNPDATQMLESGTTDTGAPLVDRNNQVISGNGRTMGIRNAVEKGRADKFFGDMRAFARERGLNIDGIKKPIVIRRIADEDIDLKDLAERSNRSNKLEYTEAEKASNDADIIKRKKMLDIFNPSEDGTILVNQNMEFVNEFLQDVNDGSLQDSRGEINKDAFEKRVRNAIIASVFGNDKDLTRRLIEENREFGLKRQIDGLSAEAGRILKVGETKAPYDIREDLTAAMKKLLEYKQLLDSGKIKKGVDAFLNQMDFFEKEEISPESEMLFRFLEGAKSVKQIRDGLNSYLDAAYKVDTNTDSMFADMEDESKHDMLKRTLFQNNSAPDLFAKEEATTQATTQANTQANTQATTQANTQATTQVKTKSQDKESSNTEKVENVKETELEQNPLNVLPAWANDKSVDNYVAKWYDEIVKMGNKLKTTDIKREEAINAAYDKVSSFIYNGMPGFDPETSKPITYLSTMVKNSFRDKFRENKSVDDATFSGDAVNAETGSSAFDNIADTIKEDQKNESDLFDAKKKSAADFRDTFPKKSTKYKIMDYVLKQAEKTGSFDGDFSQQKMGKDLSLSDSTISENMSVLKKDFSKYWEEHKERYYHIPRQGRKHHKQIIPIVQDGIVRDKHQELLENRDYTPETIEQWDERAIEWIVDQGGLKGAFEQLMKDTQHSDRHVNTLVYRHIMESDYFRDEVPHDKQVKFHMKYIENMGTTWGREGVARRLASMTLDSVAKLQAVINKIGDKMQDADWRKLREKVLKDTGVDINDVSEKIDSKDRSAMDKVLTSIYSNSSGMLDKAYEYWINAILSGPGTHTTNTIGNISNIAYEMGLKRAVEATVNLVAKNKDAATFGEFKQIWDNINLKDTLSRAWALSSLEMTGEDSKLKENSSVAITGKKGKIIRFPSRILRFADEVAKMVVVPAEAAALAYRDGKAKGLKGTDLDEYIKSEINKKNSKSFGQATENVKRMVFQEDPGQFVNKLIQLKETDSAAGWVAKFMLPFVKTPFNILLQTIRKSPLGIGKLAWQTGEILTGKRKVDGEYISRVAEQLIAFGSVMVLKGLSDDDESELPIITGSSAPHGSAESKFKMNNLPPYSIRIGDNWYSYKRIEPFSGGLALIADALAAWDDVKNDRESVAGAFTKALKGSFKMVSEKSYLDSVNQLTKIMQDPERNISSWGSNFIASWVPNLTRQTIEAYYNDVQDFKSYAAEDEAIKDFFHVVTSRAGFTRRVPKIDPFGEVITKDAAEENSGIDMDFVYRLISPMQKKVVQEDDEIKNMILRYNNANPDSAYWPNIPSNKFKANGENAFFESEDYQEYLIDSGKLAKKQLDNAIRSGALNISNPTEKDMELVKKVFQRARKETRKKFIAKGRYRTEEKE